MHRYGEIYTVGGVRVKLNEEYANVFRVERELGQSMGLDVKMDLSEQCADFYLLERLRHDLFEQELYHEAGSIRSRLTDRPKAWGTDTKLERLSYDVQATFDRLETKIADAFSRYLVLACGGELRHGVARGLDDPENVCEHVCDIENCYVINCPHDCDNDCCGHIHQDHINPAGLLQPKPCPVPSCGCLCEHGHDSVACVDGQDGCYEQSCCAHSCSLDTCYQENCEHACSDDDLCYDYENRRLEFTAAPELAPYLDWSRELSCAEGLSRTMGWEKWLETAQNIGVTRAMGYCADAFEENRWAGGYGGAHWATAARLVADYYSKNITRRLFIDRCWSLQHNSGCIFNKLWLLPTLVHEDGSYMSFANRKSYDLLLYVLNVQQRELYDQLAEFASFSVRMMWTEVARINGRKMKTTVLEEVA